ncbi:hypothetical protein F4861DRAFT_525644 [Xylaria intraflava]|nr:hypothetical protein F4861DRAFT_525644 [Xylaria intraflava]
MSCFPHILSWLVRSCLARLCFPTLLRLSVYLSFGYASAGPSVSNLDGRTSSSVREVCTGGICDSMRWVRGGCVWRA